MLLLFNQVKTHAQALPLDEQKVTKQFPQVSLVFNRIFNSSGLDSFYYRLQQLKKTKKGKVT